MISKTISPLVNSSDFIDRLRAFDEGTWERVFCAYARDLENDIKASLRRRGFSTSEADDILQSTWVTAVRKIEEFEPRGDYDFYKWLRVISLNHVRNYVRYSRQDISLESVDNDFDQPDLMIDAISFSQDSLEMSVEQQIILNEAIEELVQLLQDLKPQDRAIFVRRYVFDDPPRQLAIDFPNLQPESISMKLIRMKKKLAVMYGATHD
jgi:RNA polymerase sigma factor (sigma-70 family)